jgi:hypothetical protein
VTVHAEVGEMFPPLELVRRMGDCTRTNFQLSGEGLRQSAQSSEVIHVGIRMPDFDVRHRGNLSRSAQEMVLRRLRAELEKRFEWRVARAMFDAETHQAFCYPYLGNAGGSVVFCRLQVKDHIPATQKATFESSFFHQA